MLACETFSLTVNSATEFLCKSRDNRDYGTANVTKISIYHRPLAVQYIIIVKLQDEDRTQG